ncbi:MAG: Uncharacterised protein [Alphaproteobacteria bacterium]|nr:MAG: Uncharacterised protein [Alphaproteobacteria bacterium]
MAQCLAHKGAKIFIQNLRRAHHFAATRIGNLTAIIGAEIDHEKLTAIIRAHEIGKGLLLVGRQCFRGVDMA